MQSFTWSAVLGRWTFSPAGVLLTLLVVVGYGWAWRRARSRGVRLSWARPVMLLLMAVLPLVVATCSGLQSLRGTTMQAACWQAGLLGAVVPAGLAAAAPVTVLHGALDARGRARLDAVTRSLPARVLAFPLVSAVVAGGVLLAYFLTGWFQATLTSAPLREVSLLVLVAAGALFLLPMVGEGEEVLPAWCTPPVRAGLAFVDGAVDAIPGLVVMTASSPLWHPVVGSMGHDELMGDQSLAGAVLLCLAEVVAIPVLATVVVAWMRADTQQAREYDAALDRQERERAARTAPQSRAGDAPTATGAAAPGTAPTDPDEAPAVDQPWWLTDPRFAERYGRREEDGR